MGEILGSCAHILFLLKFLPTLKSQCSLVDPACSKDCYGSLTTTFYCLHFLLSSVKKSCHSLHLHLFIYSVIIYTSQNSCIYFIWGAIMQFHSWLVLLLKLSQFWLLVSLLPPWLFWSTPWLLAPNRPPGLCWTVFASAFESTSSTKNSSFFWEKMAFGLHSLVCYWRGSYLGPLRGQS